MAEIKTVAVNWATSDEHNTIAEALAYALAPALAKALDWTLDGLKVYSTQKAYFYISTYSTGGVSISVSNGVTGSYANSISYGSSLTEGFVYLHYIKTDKTVAVGITNTNSSRTLTCAITRTTDGNILMMGQYNNSTMPFSVFNEDSTSLCVLPFPSFSANNAIAFRLPDPLNGGLCDDVYLLYYSPNTIPNNATTVISIGGKSFAVLCGTPNSIHGSIMVKL